MTYSVQKYPGNARVSPPLQAPLTPPLKKVKKQGEIALPCLGPIPLKKVEFRDGTRIEVDIESTCKLTVRHSSSFTVYYSFITILPMLIKNIQWEANHIL